MSSEKLNQAVSLIKAGNKPAALPILKEIVQAEPNNEMAWLWLYSCVSTTPQKTYCLQQALKINPNNENARLALEKLSTQAPQRLTPGQVPNPKPADEKPLVSKESASAASKVKTKSKRNLWAVGGITIFLLCCISGVVLGGGWVYKRYSAINSAPVSMEQNESPTEDISAENYATDEPNPALISLTPTPESQAADAEQAQVATSTPTPPPLPDVRLTVQYAERVDGIYKNLETGILDTTTGSDTFIVYLGIENQSDKFILPELTSVKVITAEGYEYDCGGDTDDHFLIPQTKTVYSVKYCEIPELTTGHKFIYTYTLTSPREVSQYNGQNYLGEYTWEPQPFEFVFTPINISFSSPFLQSYNTGTYQNENISVHHFGETLPLGDVDLTYQPTESEANFTISLKNRFIGGTSQLQMKGYLYLPDDEQVYNCRFNETLNPAENKDLAVNVGDLFGSLSGGCYYVANLQAVHSKEYSPELYFKGLGLGSHDEYVPSMTLPSGSCFLWYEILATNSQGTYQVTLLDSYDMNQSPQNKYEMICVK